MQKTKNIAIGFLVSFIGSVPFGYLNLVGFEFYQTFGIYQTVLYLVGVISVEVIVVYFSLLFVKQLLAKTQVIKFIECFSIVFMFLLAVFFLFECIKRNYKSYCSKSIY